MTTHSKSVSRLVWAGAALLLLLATLAACSSDPTATPVSQPTPTPEPEPTATPMPASDGMSAGGWRTDVAVGHEHGDRAANASITLPDGSTTTLESAAAGRGVLLYFFATW